MKELPLQLGMTIVWPIVLLTVLLTVWLTGTLLIYCLRSVFAWWNFLCRPVLCRCLLLSLAWVGFVPGVYAVETSETVYVALASSLRFVWQPWLEKALQASEPGHISSATSETRVPEADIRVTFGASGNLSRQILQGAPFRIFISANEDYVERVSTQSRDVSEERFVAVGPLAWVVRRGQNDSLSKLLSAEATVVADQAGSVNKLIPVPGGEISPAKITQLSLAIANPRHAPYGEAAVGLLQSYGLDKRDFAVVLEGENAGHALHFLKSGGADLALVPVSLLKSNSHEFDWVTADSTLYSPVSHHILLLGEHAGSSATRKLFEGLLSKDALDVLEGFGLQLVSGNEF